MIRPPNEGIEVWLCVEPVDFRKQNYESELAERDAAIAKYADALPLYRQHQQLQRIGVDLSRTTLATWMVRAGALVVPLLNLLRDELLDRPYLLMDETTVQVLEEPGKAARSKSQLWAQMSAGPPLPARGGRLRAAHRAVRG